MTDAQTILKMIEEVDPADTAKLDEIDSRVQDYVGSGYNCFRITRSRNELKSIRPDGWPFIEVHTGELGSWVSISRHGLNRSDEQTCIVGNLPTEELAELHAIIQAIENERTHK